MTNVLHTYETLFAQLTPLLQSKTINIKKLDEGLFAKCQALWNKITRSVLAAEVMENESSLQLERPCSTRWNSVYDAVRRLNKIIELNGSCTI